MNFLHVVDGVFRVRGVRGDDLITDFFSYRKLKMDVFEDVKLNP